jgi:hypothetical protein
MLKEREIRDQLAAYLEGAVPLREFSGWLYRETWDMAGSDPGARAFAYEVLGRVAERSTAGFGEQELREELRRLAEHAVTRVTLAPLSEPPIRATSTGVAMEIRPPIAVEF